MAGKEFRQVTFATTFGAEQGNSFDGWGVVHWIVNVFSGYITIIKAVEN